MGTSSHSLLENSKRYVLIRNVNVQLKLGIKMNYISSVWLLLFFFSFFFFLKKRSNAYKAAI